MVNMNNSDQPRTPDGRYSMTGAPEPVIALPPRPAPGVSDALADACHDRGFDPTPDECEDMEGLVIDRVSDFIQDNAEPGTDRNENPMHAEWQEALDSGRDPLFYACAEAGIDRGELTRAQVLSLDEDARERAWGDVLGPSLDDMEDNR